jgi:hypothetical protein
MNFDTIRRVSKECLVKVWEQMEIPLVRERRSSTKENTTFLKGINMGENEKGKTAESECIHRRFGMMLWGDQPDDLRGYSIKCYGAFENVPTRSEHRFAAD